MSQGPDHGWIFREDRVPLCSPNFPNVQDAATGKLHSSVEA